MDTYVPSQGLGRGTKIYSFIDYSINLSTEVMIISMVGLLKCDWMGYIVPGTSNTGGSNKSIG